MLVQLSNSFSHFIIGDLGISMRTNRSVSILIADVLPSTLILAFTGLVVALLLAITIAYGTRFLRKEFGQGCFAAFHPYSCQCPIS